MYELAIYLVGNMCISSIRWCISLRGVIVYINVVAHQNCLSQSN